jgi:hypothetical protein
MRAVLHIEFWLKELEKIFETGRLFHTNHSRCPEVNVVQSRLKPQLLGFRISRMGSQADSQACNLTKTVYPCTCDVFVNNATLPEYHALLTAEVEASTVVQLIKRQHVPQPCVCFTEVIEGLNAAVSVPRL